MQNRVSVPIESTDATEEVRELIFRRRCTELRQAGYGSKDAILLALNTDVDLLALELPARGCPHSTAMRILI